MGAGSAWVSVAGGTGDGTLPAAACTPVESGGATADVLIASDLPLQGDGAEVTRGLADAIRWVLKDHGFRAGRHVVGYQSCDESTAQTGSYERRRCAANANAFARAEQVVAVIGPFSSFCAQLQIPILNRAPGGPLALVSPSNSDRGLTRGPPTGTPPNTTLASSAAPMSRASHWRCSRSDCGSRVSTCSTPTMTPPGSAQLIRSAASPRDSASGSPGLRTSASTRASTPPSPTGSPAPESTGS